MKVEPSLLFTMAFFPSLNQIKKQAKVFKKYKKMSPKEALDLAAQSYGFSNYRMAKTMLRIK